MKKSVLFILFFLGVGLFAKDFSMKLIRTIGDEREDYTFFRISEARFTDDKDILVGDNKGLYIAKYSWDGKLIKKVGRKGQGPGDFLVLSSFDFYKNNLYFYDIRNSRIAIIDKNLENSQYLGFYNNKFFQHMRVIDENHFIGDILFISEKYWKNYNLFILNKKSEVVTPFFEYSQFGKLGKSSKNMTPGMFMTRLLKRMDVSRKEKKIIVAFRYSNNPAQYWIYDFKGNLIKTFKYQGEKDFGFAKFLNKSKNRRKLEEDKFISLGSLLFYKDYILSIVNYNITSKKENKTTTIKSKCVIFNKQGNYLGEIKLNELTCFYEVSDDGHIIAAKIEEEEPKIYIYKLNF